MQDEAGVWSNVKSVGSVNAEMLSGAAPLLVKVTLPVVAALEALTVVLGKVNPPEGALRLTLAEPFTVPETAMFWLPPFDAIARVPLFAPATPVSNETVIVQFAFDATAAVQLWVTPKSAAARPVTDVTDRFVRPVLVIVIACVGAVLAPNAVAGKVIVVVEAVRIAPATGFPM